MVTTLITFFAALRAGEAWARFLAIGIGLVAFLSFIGWQISRIEDRGAKKAEVQRVIESQERITEMEKNNAKSRALSEIERCRALAVDSGLQPAICD